MSNKPQVQTAPTRIIIEVRNGELQTVGCSDPKAAAVVVDWDANGKGLPKSDLVDVGPDGFPYFARVHEVAACTLDALHGTEVEDAFNTDRFSQFCHGHEFANVRQTRVVIDFKDAIVQSVFCSAPDAQLVVVDWDRNTSSDLMDAALVDRYRDGVLVCARVYRFPVYSISQLPGSDISEAICGSDLAEAVFNGDDREFTLEMFPTDFPTFS